MENVLSRCDEYLNKWNSNSGEMREQFHRDGFYTLYENVEKLRKFSLEVNLHVFVYLFGEQRGAHMTHIFINKYQRDVLKYFTYLDDQERFFIIHEITKNKNLYKDAKFTDLGSAVEHLKRAEM